jgi:hypothetical protein
LFTVPVDFDDRVVDVHEDGAVDPGDDRGPIGQPAQKPGPDGIELADVPEGEFTQERPQRRRCVRVIEDRSHRPVSQQCHVVDTVGAGDHARYQRGDLPAGVGTFVGAHCQAFIGQCAQVALLRQRHGRDQARAGHEIGVVELRGRDGSDVR